MSDRGLGRSDWLLMPWEGWWRPPCHHCGTRPRAAWELSSSSAASFRRFSRTVSHFVELFSVLITLTPPVFLNVPDVLTVTLIAACGAFMGESAHVTGGY